MLRVRTCQVIRASRTWHQDQRKPTNAEIPTHLPTYSPLSFHFISFPPRSPPLSHPPPTTPSLTSRNEPHSSTLTASNQPSILSYLSVRPSSSPTIQSTRLYLTSPYPVPKYPPDPEPTTHTHTQAGKQASKQANQHAKSRTIPPWGGQRQTWKKKQQVNPGPLRVFLTQNIYIYMYI